jgi:hypothetical protein
MSEEENKFIAFFLNNQASVIMYDTIEISHPNMSQIYYLVRNNSNGLVATDENSNVLTFQYLPFVISKGKSSSTDLDQTFEVQLGDLGDILATEIDAIILADGMATKPVIKYRGFASDNLAAPIYGPLRYEINSVPRNSDGNSISASVARLADNKTGEAYTIDLLGVMGKTLL